MPLELVVTVTVRAEEPVPTVKESVKLVVLLVESDWVND